MVSYQKVQWFYHNISIKFKKILKLSNGIKILCQIHISEKEVQNANTISSKFTKR